MVSDEKLRHRIEVDTEPRLAVHVEDGVSTPAIRYVHFR